MFPKEQLGAMFDILAVWLAEDRSRRLGFTWHGGEPMLLGQEFYATVIQEQERAFGGERDRVRNNMQSNLSLVTEEGIACLHGLLSGLSIGTSFDIVEGIRGLASRRHLPTQWFRAVRLLRRHGISVGVVYVVHRRSIARARDLYYFFRNLDPHMSVRFNPLYREGRARGEPAQPFWVTAEEYGGFLVKLFDTWMDDDMRTSVMPLTEWYNAWQGPTRLCCDSSGKCHDSHIGIDPDGVVYGCGRFSDNAAHPLGNIFEHDFQTILQHAPRRDLADRSLRLLKGPCKDCRYWGMCRGGCPMMGWLYHGDLFRETYFCAARKRLFRRFEEVLGPPADYCRTCDTARERDAYVG